MRAFTTILAGGVAIAALASAAPAAAQYYPGYGYGYGYGNPYGGNVVGQVLNNVLGGGYGYGSQYGYGANSQVAVNQCAAAVQARLSRSSYGYGYGGGYGGRVLGISRVEPRGDGGLRIRGVATSGYSGQPDLTFSCKTDYRGFIRDVDVDRASGAYGYNRGYNPYDYSQYGYRRY